MGGAIGGFAVSHKNVKTHHFSKLRDESISRLRKTPRGNRGRALTCRERQKIINLMFNLLICLLTNLLQDVTCVEDEERREKKLKVCLWQVD